MHTAYMSDGMLIIDSKLCRRNYWRSRPYLDFLSVIPLEVIFLGLGYHPSFRFNRLLKIPRLYTFINKHRHRTNRPYLTQFLALMAKLALVLHVDACIYMFVSTKIGLGSDTFVMPAASNVNGNLCSTCWSPIYESVSIQYLQSLLWAAQTLMVCSGVVLLY